MLDYVLDTNICIYIARQKPPEVLKKFTTLKVGSVGMSMITYGELLFGTKRSNNAEKAKNLLDELVTFIPVLPMDLSVADHYSDIRAELSMSGNIIGCNDLWIAAHVRAIGKCLVTNNEKEFTRVSNLRVENWVS